METLETKIKQNSANKFYCKNCDYGTCRKSNFESHLNSLRHSRGNKMETNSAKLSKIKQNNNQTKYTCNNCDKEFLNRSGLWKHNKICYKQKSQFLNSEFLNSDLLHLFSFNTLIVCVYIK